MSSRAFSYTACHIQAGDKAFLSVCLTDWRWPFIKQVERERLRSDGDLLFSGWLYTSRILSWARHICNVTNLSFFQTWMNWIIMSYVLDFGRFLFSWFLEVACALCDCLLVFGLTPVYDSVSIVYYQTTTKNITLIYVLCLSPSFMKFQYTAVTEPTSQQDTSDSLYHNYVLATRLSSLYSTRPQNDTSQQISASNLHPASLLSTWVDSHQHTNSPPLVPPVATSSYF